MRTVPAAAKLHKRNARKNIGFTVLNLDRSVYAGFTREGVVEERPGFYVAESGVSAPSTGGYIVWGLKTRSIVESSIEPMPEDPTPTIAANLVAALTEADRRTSERINRIYELIEAIDINTPLQAAQAAITVSISESVSETAIGTKLISDSLVEQIGNRLKLNEDHSTLLESLLHRVEESQRGLDANQEDELALGTQIGDILGYIGDIREAVNGGSERIEKLEESIRHSADIEATIARQKATITEFFELLEVAE